MDIFHHNLKPVEEFGFGKLYFTEEMLCQVFIDDAITGGKEG